MFRQFSSYIPEGLETIVTNNVSLWHPRCRLLSSWRKLFTVTSRADYRLSNNKCFHFKHLGCEVVRSFGNEDGNFEECVVWKHVLHVYFVFVQPIDLFRLSIQIMLRYLEGLNLCRVLWKDWVRACKCPTLKDNTLLGIVTWSVLGKPNRQANS